MPASSYVVNLVRVLTYPPYEQKPFKINVSGGQYDHDFPCLRIYP